MTGHHDDRPVDAEEPVDELSADPRAAEVLALAAGDVVPPDELRPRVLAAALRARPPGRPNGAVAEIDAVEALGRTLRDLAALVDSLSDADGEQRTIEGWSVRGLIGHLGAVERYTGGVLGWWAAEHDGDDADHLAMTLDAVASAEAGTLDVARERWHVAADEVRRRLPSLAGRLDERARLHGFDFSVRSVLVARTFEVWTHHEDIVRAVGRPTHELETERLRLMTAAAVGALPLGMLLAGRESRGRSVRVVLSGPGGGSWLQPLDHGVTAGDAPEPSATLLADAVDFCRVAAKRLAPERLDVRVAGDRELVDDVLAAVRVFAA